MAHQTFWPPALPFTGKTIRVVAIERGFDNTLIREPGDEFDMPADTRIDTESWFVPVADAPAAPKPRAKAAPRNPDVNDL